MPELPEVETTTKGLKKKILGLKIKDVWTDLNTKDKRKWDTIAYPKYFDFFKKEVINKEILSVERRAKNILINLSNQKTILIHMKMTGHLLYGKYKFNKNENKWIPNEEGPLKDPYNRFIHFVFIFYPSASLKIKDSKCLAFSDTRKFGKITLLSTEEKDLSKHLKNIGLDPFDKKLNEKSFEDILKRKQNGKIKTVLMDQSLISGIGNIYSDEILWKTNIHPERKISCITKDEFKKMFKNMREILTKGIDFGGDSMSDYRNIYGEKGKFQLHHKVYRRLGEKCKKKGCNGVIIRKIIGGRSAHFCSVHQK